jgi:4-amino-4-deoxy-L-arabinose transferase-like glycosyltransferase
VIAITLVAAGLRFSGLGLVPLDPFYDAAVRSMSRSWHNFFFGAFDPSARTAIDKPPLDLWLQVAAIKVFGYNATALRVPQALAGTFAPALLYDTVRRVAGRGAGVAAAAVLAVLPISVLTARSDTMDSVMTFLLVACAWLLVRAAQLPPERRTRALVAVALLLGLAFNVKLFEALVPAPAFAVGAWLLLEGSARVRARRAGLITAAFLVGALWWLTAVSVVPVAHRPFALGSSDGSVWNAVFVYNGSDRIFGDRHAEAAGPATALIASARRGPALLRHAAPVHRHHAAQASPPGPLRLLRKSFVDYGGLLGVELLAGAVFLLLGLALARARGWRPSRPRTARGFAAVVVGLWWAAGVILFSFEHRVQTRYLEAFTPAVAVLLGVGLAAVAGRVRSREGTAALLAGLTVSIAYAAHVTGVGTIVHTGLRVGLIIGAVTFVLALVALALALRRGWPRWWSPGVAGTLALAAVLAFPVSRDVRIERRHESDEPSTIHLTAIVLRSLSRYLRAHQGGARYETAVSAPTLAAPLITQDARPVLLLTSIGGRPIVSLSQFVADVRSREVGYLLTRGVCPRRRNPALAACSLTVEWAVAHGRNVTSAVTRGGLGQLYQLS